MLAGTLLPAPDGMSGIDCNDPLTPETAAAFFSRGDRYAIRYLPRITPHPNDLTSEEAAIILAAGLHLMAVQHVESEDGWIPSLAKGTQYGAVAAEQMTTIGFPIGSYCALDLEGVAVGTPASMVSGYCNLWYDAVHAAEFVPVLYVGWHCGLNASQLYHALKFSRYWGAYNLNADEEPLVRGLCMKQHAAVPADIPPGVTFGFDKNTTMTDAKGGTIILLGPAAT